MRKGNPILIEGRLQYDTWEGKDGVKRSKHRVFVERFQFLGSPAQGQGRPAAAAPPPAASQRPAPAPEAPPEEFAEPAPPEVEETGGETIPF
jgi:single-strand DNA-binding protein